MAKKEELQTQNLSNLAVPDWLEKGDNRGKDNVAREDVQMPRLGLAQKQSPQLESTDPKFIPELREGMFFNDLTGEVYSSGPLYFCVIRRDPPRGIEFAPIDSGGGVIDPDVPLNDPRMQFTTDENGKRVKPVATKYYDYIIMLIKQDGEMEPIALSLKSSGIKVAKQLNGFIQWRKGPMHAGRFTLQSKPKAVPKPHYIHVVGNAGYVTKEQFDLANDAYESIKNASLIIARDQHDADSFDPEVIESESQPVEDPNT
jgi:hypothetical protein